jgi:hypothetical protein
MGIDIYAHWDDQSEAERRAQREVWGQLDAGGVGYLREPYLGEPYATRHLVPEAFTVIEGARIPAALLRERLAETLRLADGRARGLYGFTESEEIEPILASYNAFVDLCEWLEKAGTPPRIQAWW